MCGITAYCGNGEALPFLMQGLAKLEYRGYDSAGIAINENGKINLYKKKGKLSNLENELSTKDINSNTGIGHTRWATHGIPNEINAHPHMVGNVTLVHNGIIENYNELKSYLIQKGVNFNSQTDTEVACAYINYVYENMKDFKDENERKLKSILKACMDFRGSYAFGIIFKDTPDVIYSTRKDSPLVIGLSDEGNFIASDISAILDYTKKYILLDFMEFAKIEKDNVTIYNKKLDIITKKINEATWSATECKKNGYEHFMLKEINEQPSAIKNVYSRFFENKDENYSKVDFSKYTNIHIVACGSAMHASLIGKYLFENYANIPTTVEIASEYRYKKLLLSSSTLVIIVSQSGETADSLAALRISKENKATVLGIVNAVGSTIAREANITIYTHAGPEIAVATTKGYTTQVATFACLVINAMKQKNIKYDFTLENEYNNIDKIIKSVIDKTNEYKDIAKSLSNRNDIFFIGRGNDYNMCMEGSLKLKEISYIHSEAYPAGELKHGTISLIEEGTPVIAIATDKQLYEKTVSNIKETKARGAFTIFITTEEFKDTYTKDFADITLFLPTTSLFNEAIIIVTALQLIAYETAKLRGCDIDKPKNLAKSVTVE